MNDLLMKKFFALHILVLCSLACNAQPKPNIIVIVADDMGWGDVGFHGADIRTPNIDRLAREGMMLNRFYTAPICSPTRAGLMTGRYPNRFGLRESVIPPWSTFGVDTSEVFLPQMLVKAGYKNRAALGKWHLGHAQKKFLPLQRGFTHFYGHYNGALDYFTQKREGERDWHFDDKASADTGYTTDLITTEAKRCVKTYAKEGSPFFLYVAFNAPHGPLQAKHEDLLAYGFDPAKPIFNDAGGEQPEAIKGRGNTKRQTYQAMVSCMDRGIGQIMQALKESGADKNTLVIFLSDNGAAPGGGGSSGPLRGKKFQEWEGGVRSPAIARWPGKITAGSKTEQLMGYIDLLPTFAAIGGTKPFGKPLDGQTMDAVFTGKKPATPRDLYLGNGTIISGNWKLVKANAGNPRMQEKTDQLFNIDKDPGEKTNVKEAQPKVYQSLLAKLKPYDAIRSAEKVDVFEAGRKGFKAPKDWQIGQ